MHRTDQDPIWQSIQPVERLLVGDLGGARALLPMQIPGVFMDPPNVAGTHDIDLAIAAQILRQTGSRRRVPTPCSRRGFRPVRNWPGRARIPRHWRDAAIFWRRRTERTRRSTMFERAFAAGWRLPIEFDYFVRSEDFPFMAAVAATPRWKRLMQALAKDMAIMRDRVKATNATWNGRRSPIGGECTRRCRKRERPDHALKLTIWVSVTRSNPPWNGEDFYRLFIAASTQAIISILPKAARSGPTLVVRETGADPPQPREETRHGCNCTACIAAHQSSGSAASTAPTCIGRCERAGRISWRSAATSS